MPAAFTASGRRAAVRAVLLFACMGALARPADAQTPPDRSVPPRLGPAPAMRLPPIERRVLSNGVPVWIVELHEVPVAAVTVLVKAGSAADPADRFGLATLTAAMLDEGAGTRSALELADEIEYLGASLATGSSWDASAVRLQVPVARLSQALPIMADVALRPTFPEKELERLRQERLTTLLQARDNPATLISIAFPRFVFGQAHRFGTPAFGTSDSVRRITTGDLRRFYDERYQPQDAALIVAGDVTAAGVLPMMESAFGAWRAATGPTPQPVPPAAPAAKTRRIILVDRPGAPQSQIRIGGPGVARSTPDYFSIQVLNTILGGSFGSRLNQNLREQHGYTYGASSTFDMRVSAGPFVAGAGVQTDRTADAVKEFFNELNGILKLPPAGEVERAKNLVALGFPSEFETTGDLSRRLEELFVYSLTTDYFSTYVQRVQAVTPQDVLAAAKKYIRPETMTTVIVGDAGKIRSALEGLKLGAVTLATPDEVLGPATP